MEESERERKKKEIDKCRERKGVESVLVVEVVVGLYGVKRLTTPSF